MSGDSWPGSARTPVDLQARSPMVTTISQGRPNRIVKVEPAGSGSNGGIAGEGLGRAARAGVDDPGGVGPPPIRGILEEPYLLATDGFNVKRSAAGNALLAHPPA